MACSGWKCGVLPGSAVWGLGGSVKGDEEQTSGKAFLACRRSSRVCKHTCVPISWITSSRSRKDYEVRKHWGL